jgi:polysaccharide biosynthesis/export protein
MTRPSGSWVWVALCLAGLGACASPTPQATAPKVSPLAMMAVGQGSAAATGTPQYTLAAGDEIDIRVPDAPQLDQTLKVRPDGKVSLALVGTLQAQGRTPEELQDVLRERLQALSGAAGERDYLLQPNDEIEVKFPWYPQLNEVLKLRPDGKIALQLVGTLVAEGLSPEELQAALRVRYAKYLKSPELSVIVRSVTTQNVRVAGGRGRAGMAGLEPVVVARSFQAPQVFVGGEVGRPGVLAFRPGLSLVQALVEAGGQLPSADMTQLLVLRRGADGQALSLHPALDADFLKSPGSDLVLQPFDVVLLPKSDVASLADRLNLYVFNLFPPLKNSSLGFSYTLRPNAKN